MSSSRTIARTDRNSDCPPSVIRIVMIDRDNAPDFAALIVEYRRVIAECDAAADDFDRWNEYMDMARRLRQTWAEWSGDDDLHEVAFDVSD